VQHLFADDRHSAQVLLSRPGIIQTITADICWRIESK